MNFLKTALRISAQNFRKWQTDYRIWTIAFFIIILTLIYVDDIKKVADYLGSEVPVWVFPFLYPKPYQKALFTLPVVLMFCDAPFVDKNQVFVMMRTSKIKWLCGQLFYIISAAAVYYLFIFAISILFTIIYGGFSLEWGKTLTEMAYDGNLAYVAGAGSLTVSQKTVKYFTPLLACFYTYLMSWLTAVFLGLLVFVLNLFTGSRIWGIAVSCFFVILNSIAKGHKYLDRFSPVTWSTLDGIDVGGITVRPSFAYCITAVLVSIILLAASVLIFGKKKNFDVKGER